eukprot:5605556-Amphidinium_carterae.1
MHFAAAGFALRFGFRFPPDADADVGEGLALAIETATAKRGKLPATISTNSWAADTGSVSWSMPGAHQGRTTLVLTSLNMSHSFTGFNQLPQNCLEQCWGFRLCAQRLSEFKPVDVRLSMRQGNADRWDGQNM